MYSARIWSYIRVKASITRGRLQRQQPQYAKNYIGMIIIIIMTVWRRDRRDCNEVGGISKICSDHHLGGRHEECWGQIITVEDWRSPSSLPFGYYFRKGRAHFLGILNQFDITPRNWEHRQKLCHCPSVRIGLPSSAQCRWTSLELGQIWIIVGFSRWLNRWTEINFSKLLVRYWNQLFFSSHHSDYQGDILTLIMNTCLGCSHHIHIMYLSDRTVEFENFT